MKAVRLIVTSALVLATVSACGRHEPSGPPDLRLGLDQCAACGMIVNEERCSSALLIERESHRESLIFDDLGCMLDFEAGNGGEKVIDRFVHDHSTKSWVHANDAFFLSAPPGKVSTPMGSGIVAFAARVAAEKARSQFGGDCMEFAQLRSAYQARSESHPGRKRNEP